MPATQRMGDANDAGGVINNIPQSTVYANGLLIAVDGSRGTGHPPGVPPHTPGAWTTTGGAPTVFAGGSPVNCEGDPDSCGHSRVGGSPNVFSP